MSKVVHRAESRGRAETGWLKARYSFSFADWYEPSRMGFGALRVINDDVIAPGMGFGMHGHRDMEIITVVTRGTLTHKDSMGNVGTIEAGDVQAMSAGTGVMHSEYNAGKSELASFQIWIEPKTLGIAPRYDQKSFGLEKLGNGLRLLVGPAKTLDSLSINQEAYIYYAALDAGHPIGYKPIEKSHGVYLFVIDGEVAIAGDHLGPRDAIGLSDAEKISISSPSSAKILLFEVPMQ